MELLQPGIEPVPPALEAWSHNHWTTREVQNSLVLYFVLAKLTCWPNLFLMTEKENCAYMQTFSGKNEPLLIPGTNLCVIGFFQPDASARFGEKFCFSFLFFKIVFRSHVDTVLDQAFMGLSRLVGG